jgi:hypothetical protein
MGLNEEVDNEFGVPEGRTALLDTATLGRTASNDVPDESIFTKGIQLQRLPELDAEFVMQKSKEDRLVELADKSAEIEDSGGISRADVIAIESIIEDLEGNGTEAPPEQQEPPEQSDEEETPPVRKQPMGNPNLYTEEKSKTEYKPALSLMRSNYEKAYTDLKATVIDLGKKLLDVSEQELQEKRLAYTDISVQFNKNIIRFLNEYESDDLETVKCSFSKHLKWAGLMGVGLYLLRPHLIDYEEGRRLAEVMRTDFEGTKTGEFIENLSKVFRSDSVNSTIKTVVFGDFYRVTNGPKTYVIDPATGEYKPWGNGNSDRTVSEPSYSNNCTIGGIFGFIGAGKLSTVIQSRILAYDYCRQVIQDTLDKTSELESQQDNTTLKDKLDTLLEYSGKINEAKFLMSALLADIGAIFAVYEVINNYMLDMCE